MKEICSYLLHIGVKNYDLSSKLELVWVIKTVCFDYCSSHFKNLALESVLLISIAIKQGIS